MRAIARQGLDGGDETALESPDRNQAAPHWPTIDMHRAGAAMAGSAAIFGAGEVGCVTQRPEQGRLGIEAVMEGLPVHRELGHAASLNGNRARGNPPVQPASGSVPRWIRTPSAAGSCAA